MPFVHRKLTNLSYQLCSGCYFKKYDACQEWYGIDLEYDHDEKHWNYIQDFVHCPFVCSNCQQPQEDAPKERWAYRRRHSFSGHRYKPDTRRRNAAGKLIGGHHGHQWSFDLHEGKEYKRYLHQAERRMWKRYAKDVLEDPEHEPRLRDSVFCNLSREVNWKLW